jgi:uncharacterized protein YjbI with pentapeptide repeats
VFKPAYGLSRRATRFAGSITRGGALRATFEFATLRGARLENASLVRTDFSHATVEDCDFSGADLSAATLSHSAWRRCNLSHAILAIAVLDGTCLSETDLTHAELSRAFFAGTTMAGADLTGATMGRTVLAACEDLARARGLDAVVHRGHSCVDLMTLRAGLDTLPEGFLQGAGVDAEEVGALRAALSGAH